MGRLCYLSRAYRNGTSAGNKAKSDYEDILVAHGAVNLGLRRSYGGGKARIFLRNLVGVARFALGVRRGDTVVLQYPVKKYFRLLCGVARLRGARTVALVHDLGSWRRRALTVAQELKRFFAGKVYSVVIPRNVRVSEAPSHGKPIGAYDRTCRGAEAYTALAAEFLRKNNC